MIVTIIAVVGTLFVAAPDGSKATAEALIFSDMATCRSAGDEAKLALEAQGWVVRSTCLDTGVAIKMRLEGKAS